MYIPLRIRLLHNFGRSSFIIGFLFSLIGIAFVVYFSMQLNWKILLAGQDDFLSTNAHITDIVETQFLVNDTPLYEYSYTYSFDDNKPIPGSFLEFRETYSRGEQITVDYLRDEPTVSKIKGKDRSNYDQIMFFAGIVGLLVGVFFLYPSIRKTRRERKILMAGIPAKANLVHAEPTNMQVNEQTVYNLIYEYSISKNQSQEFSIRSHMIRNLSEEHTEAIVYDPVNPTRTVVVDTLPAPVARYVTRRLNHSFN